MPARPTLARFLEPPPAERRREPIAPMDIVVTGLCAWPRFKVVAVVGDKAWLQNLDTGEDAITDQARCRKTLEQGSGCSVIPIAEARRSAVR